MYNDMANISYIVLFMNAMIITCYYKRSTKQRRSCTMLLWISRRHLIVPKEVVRWALRKLGAEEWLIRTVMALYTEAYTVVRTDAGLSERFEVKVDLHQGSVLSPLLFATVMDVVTRAVSPR